MTRCCCNQVTSLKSRIRDNADMSSMAQSELIAEFRHEAEQEKQTLGAENERLNESVASLRNSVNDLQVSKRLWLVASAFVLTREFMFTDTLSDSRAQIVVCKRSWTRCPVVKPLLASSRRSRRSFSGECSALYHISHHLVYCVIITLRNRFRSGWAMRKRLVATCKHLPLRWRMSWRAWRRRVSDPTTRGGRQDGHSV